MRNKMLKFHAGKKTENFFVKKKKKNIDRRESVSGK